jgi:hypothetical protein
MVLHKFVLIMNAFQEIDFMANGTKNALCHGWFQAMAQVA